MQEFRHQSLKYCKLLEKDKEHKIIYKHNDNLLKNHSSVFIIIQKPT